MRKSVKIRILNCLNHAAVQPLPPPLPLPFGLYCTRIIFHIFVPGGGWEASASNARLYMRDDHTNKRIGTWCAAYGQTDGQWLQIDLGQVKYVSAVATQGMC